MERVQQLLYRNVHTRWISGMCPFGTWKSSADSYPSWNRKFTNFHDEKYSSEAPGKSIESDDTGMTMYSVKGNLKFSSPITSCTDWFKVYAKCVTCNGADDFCQAFKFLCQHGVPDFNALENIALKFYHLIHSFYSSQLLQVFQLFAYMGFSDVSVLAAFTARIDDLVINASPLRVVFLICLCHRLKFNYSLIMDPLLRSLGNQLHNLKTEIPNILDSLAGLYIHAKSVVDPLLTQCILQKDDLESSIPRCAHGMSLHGYAGQHEMINHLSAFSKSRLDAASTHDILRCLASCNRLNLTEESNICRRVAEIRLHSIRSNDWCQKLSLLNRMYKLRLREPSFFETFIDDIELFRKNEDFLQKHISEYLFYCVSLDVKVPCFEMIASNILSTVDRKSDFSSGLSEKDMALLLYSILIEFNNRQETYKTSMSDTELMIVNRLLVRLSFCFRSLPIREKQVLKLCSLYLLHVLQLTEKDLCSDAFHCLKKVCNMTCASTIPLTPMVGDYENLNIKKVYGHQILSNKEGKNETYFFFGVKDVYAINICTPAKSKGSPLDSTTEMLDVILPENRFKAVILNTGCHELGWKFYQYISLPQS